MHTDTLLILEGPLLNKNASVVLSSLTKNVVVATHHTARRVQLSIELLLQPHSYLKLDNSKTLRTPA